MVSNYAISLACQYVLNIGDRMERTTRDGFYTHWAVFVGYINGIPYMAENQKGYGVRLIPQRDFEQAGRITNVVRYYGSPAQRKAITDRAMSRMGDGYAMFGYNCENFVNWVVEGKSYSPQVQNFVAGVAVIGGIVALFSSR